MRKIHIHEVGVLEDVLDLTGRQKILYVLRDTGRNTAPLTETLPDLNGICRRLLLLQKKVELVHIVAGGLTGTAVCSNTAPDLKRDRMVDIEPEWVHLATNDDGIQMNSYFVENPDMVLGEMKMVSGPYGPEPTCAPFPDQPLDSLGGIFGGNLHCFGKVDFIPVETVLDGENDKRLKGIAFGRPNALVKGQAP